MSSAEQNSSCQAGLGVKLSRILTGRVTPDTSAGIRFGAGHRGANVTVSSVRQKLMTVSCKIIPERGSPGLVSHSRTTESFLSPTTFLGHGFHPPSHLMKHSACLRSSHRGLLPARTKGQSSQLLWLPTHPGHVTKCHACSSLAGTPSHGHT